MVWPLGLYVAPLSDGRRPAKTFEERGFTCAVWADEAEDFAVVDVKLTSVSVGIFPKRFDRPLTCSNSIPLKYSDCVGLFILQGFGYWVRA